MNVVKFYKFRYEVHFKWHQASHPLAEASQHWCQLLLRVSLDGTWTAIWVMESNWKELQVPSPPRTRGLLAPLTRVPADQLREGSTN